MNNFATKNDKPVILFSMLKTMKVILLFCFLLSVSGCAQIIEIPKIIWGSSTRALEDARVDALSKTYRCSFNDCYDAVLSFARAKEALAQKARDQEARSQEIRAPEAGSDETNSDSDITPAHKSYFDIFINNRKKRHIVVMGIEGNVDTTEVGIFFSQPSLTTVKLEISSLSSSAKRRVAQIIFDELDLRFSESR